VASANSTFSAVTISAYGTYVNISAVGSASNLWFYYSANGSGTWPSENLGIPGACPEPLAGHLE
jgi:hypothetical protein